MPLTPFHLGPGLFLGFLTLKFFNLWAILLGSIAMDLEPIILVFFKKCYQCPHHSFLHSILGAIVGSLIISLILRKFRDKLERISLKFKISQPFSFPVLFFSSFSAWILHIFFDSFVHNDVFLFWPLKFNPLFISHKLYWPLSLTFLFIGVLSFILILKKIKKYA